MKTNVTITLKTFIMDSKQSIIDQFREFDEIQNFMDSLDEWFLSYVSNELSYRDREAHATQAGRFMRLKQFMREVENS
jgi:hypothetical protein